MNFAFNEFNMLLVGIMLLDKYPFLFCVARRFFNGQKNSLSQSLIFFFLECWFSWKVVYLDDNLKF